MTRMIFISLPVTDLKRSMAFYEALGAKNNPHFSNDEGACMVFSDVIHVMLLTHVKWRTFTTRAIPDLVDIRRRRMDRESLSRCR